MSPTGAGRPSAVGPCKPAQAVALAMLLMLGTPAHADSLGQCQASVPLGAGAQDRLLKVAAIAKAELERSGRAVAIVSRSGQALAWLGHRYSHAGLSLKANPRGPWAVRQLYFACEEQRPRVFDQGMPGFVMGVHDAAQGHVSMLLLPPAASQALAQAALDDAQALRLLGSSYSANAYAAGTQHQNCNQWLAELMGSAWATPDTQASPLPDQPTAATASTATATARDRQLAQQQLHTLGYRASELRIGGPLRWVAGWVPWVHTEDHPPALLAQGRFQVSMPAAIEDWVHTLWPGTQRVQVCHNDRFAVIRHGWAPLPDDCLPGPDDAVVDLNAPDFLY